jgi:hypothetical protein
LAAVGQVGGGDFEVEHSFAAPAGGLGRLLAGWLRGKAVRG